MCKHLKYDEQGSSASKSEPNDSIGNGGALLRQSHSQVKMVDLHKLLKVRSANLQY